MHCVTAKTVSANRVFISFYPTVHKVHTEDYICFIIIITISSSIMIGSTNGQTLQLSNIFSCFFDFVPNYISWGIVCQTSRLELKLSFSIHSSPSISLSSHDVLWVLETAWKHHRLRLGSLWLRREWGNRSDWMPITYLYDNIPIIVYKSYFISL